MTNMERAAQNILEQRIAQLEGTIADALAAMDGNLYGDARRILRTGKAKTVTATVTVLNRGGAA